MFDNLGTAIVQAIGFFGVFGFFVYQLLSEGKKTIKIPLKPARKIVNKSNDLKDKTKKKGLFDWKKKPIKPELKQKKKGIFGRKEEPIEVLDKPKKKGWFKGKF